MKLFAVLLTLLVTAAAGLAIAANGTVAFPLARCTGLQEPDHPKEVLWQRLPAIRTNPVCRSFA